MQKNKLQLSVKQNDEKSNIDEKTSFKQKASITKNNSYDPKVQQKPIDIIQKQDNEEQNKNNNNNNNHLKINRVKHNKEIKKYRTSSLNEEEMYKYIGDPIKRQEFDRERSIQQVKELHNLNMFTLGSMGIQNNKVALRALSAVQQDIEIKETFKKEGEHKNYSPVSLCGLSETNPFRNKIIHLVNHPWFNTFSLFVIGANSVIMALINEVDFITNNSDNIDLAFLVIYTLEGILKVIAMGFVMRSNSYLRDSWNILDFIVIGCGWLSNIVQNKQVATIKVIRILRPLKTINQIPNMPKLVRTILDSIPVMLEVMLLFIFSLIIFGTITTQILGGDLQNRCTAYNNDTMPYTHFGYSQKEFICLDNDSCLSRVLLLDGVDPNITVSCEYYGNPMQGAMNYDNILSSVLNIFMTISAFGWTQQMYIVRNSDNSNVYDFFFLICILFGDFIILKLLINVQAFFLAQAFNIEEGIEEDLIMKQQKKSKMNTKYDKYIEQFFPIDNQNEKKDSQEQQIIEEEVKEQNCCQKCCQKPLCCIKMSTYLEDYVIQTQKFQDTITIVILLNTAVMASSFYDQPDPLTQFQDYANLVCTFIFTVEMILKMIGFGLSVYFQDFFNKFDCLIVQVSLIDIIISYSGINSPLTAFKAFRLLRIFNVIQKWESMKVLLSTVQESISNIMNLGILMLFYLYMTTLLNKSLFSGTLTDENGIPSRFGWSTTFQSFTTMFIFLSGSNWNEITILTMSLIGNPIPAILFVFLFVIGHYMLLNLFLALLLRGIEVQNKKNNLLIDQEQKDKELAKQNDIDENIELENQENDEQNQSLQKNELTDRLKSFKKEETLEPFQNLSMEKQKSLKEKQFLIDNQASIIGSIKKNEESQTKKEKQKEVDDEDKFNSNIDIEIVQIRNLLISVSPNLKLDDQGKVLLQNYEEEENSYQFSDQMILQPNKQGLPTSDKGEDQNQDQLVSDNQLIGNSLYLFSPNNKFRVFCNDVRKNKYFQGMIYHMIALNTLLIALDEPVLVDVFQKVCIAQLLNIVSVAFIIEFIVMVVVYGFVLGQKTYLKDGWNRLDFIVVFTTIIQWLLQIQYGPTNPVVMGLKALRALRPLKVVSKIQSMKNIVNSVLASIPVLANVLLIVLLYILMFAILGLQLFQGMLGSCNDPDIQFKDLCNDTFIFNVTFDDGFINSTVLQRQWNVEMENYDNIFSSMLTFFEISTLEQWAEIMFRAVDTTAYDQGPIQNNNQWVEVIYLLFIFVMSFFILSLFVAVIVEKFNGEVKKSQGLEGFTHQETEWVKIQRQMVLTQPKMIPVEPINCLNLKLFTIAQSEFFEYISIFAIGINTIFLCIDYYGKSDQLQETLDISNYVLVSYFTIEMILKMAGYGQKFYWFVVWNKFDAVIVFLSLLGLLQNQFQALGLNVTFLKIIRVTRILRVIKVSQGLRKLLKTLLMSAPNIINVLALLILIWFTFSVAGMNLFPNADFYVEYSENANFTSFYLSMLMMIRCSTGEKWNVIMHEIQNSQGIGAVIFFCIYMIITYFIMLNVFVAVIGQSFNENQESKDMNDIIILRKQEIKAFVNNWAKYNPNAEVFMKTSRLADFLRELPPPLGYLGISLSKQVINKIIYCLNIRDHQGNVYYPEVLWAIIHSMAGINDDKVKNCKEQKAIIKTVKNKFRKLDNKLTLDALCGNKFLERKTLTAYKQIQGFKIYQKLRDIVIKKKKLNKKKKSQVNKNQEKKNENIKQQKPQDKNQTILKENIDKKINMISKQDQNKTAKSLGEKKQIFDVEVNDEYFLNRTILQNENKQENMKKPREKNGRSIPKSIQLE